MRFTLYHYRKSQYAVLLLVLAIGILSACRPPQQEVVPTATPVDAAPATPDPGDPAQAAEYWQKALEANPDDPMAHYQLGLLYLLLEREKASEHLQKAGVLEPALAPQVRRLEAALRQSSVIEDPAYQNTIIGQALASVEEWELAEYALEGAVAQDPEYAEAWAYLGEVRQQIGREDAFDALQTALQLDRQSYAANLFISFYWKRNGLPERAVPHLQQALHQDPNNLSLQEDLAITLIQAGKVETGFENIHSLIEESPEDPHLWQILARLSIENDIQVEQVGLPAARQAILLEPDNAQSTLMLGRAYFLTNEPVLAERFFNKAARQSPGLAAPHLYLGLMQLNLEKYPAARAELETALALAEISGEQEVLLQAGQILERFFPD